MSDFFNEDDELMAFYLSREKKRREDALRRALAKKESEYELRYIDKLTAMSSASNNYNFSQHVTWSSHPASWAPQSPSFTTGSNIVSVEKYADVIVKDDQEPMYERELVPILAQRYAGMIFKDSKIRFVSVVGRHGFFDIDSEAKCLKGNRNHDAPEWKCTCGFYAVPADKLPNHGRQICTVTGDSKNVVLQVQLSGKTVIHDEGYRAQYQKILEVRVPDCHCGNPSKYIWYSADSGLVIRIDCGEHKTPLITAPDWVDEVMPGFSERAVDEVSAKKLEKLLRLAGIYDMSRNGMIQIKNVSRSLDIPFTRYER